MTAKKIRCALPNKSWLICGTILATELKEPESRNNHHHIIGDLARIGPFIKKDLAKKKKPKKLQPKNQKIKKLEDSTQPWTQKSKSQKRRHRRKIQNERPKDPRKPSSTNIKKILDLPIPKWQSNPSKSNQIKPSIFDTSSDEEACTQFQPKSKPPIYIPTPLSSLPSENTDIFFLENLILRSPLQSPTRSPLQTPCNSPSPKRACFGNRTKTEYLKKLFGSP